MAGTSNSSLKCQIVFGGTVYRPLCCRGCVVVPSAHCPLPMLSGKMLRPLQTNLWFAQNGLSRIFGCNCDDRGSSGFFDVSLSSLNLIVSLVPPVVSLVVVISCGRACGVGQEGSSLQLPSLIRQALRRGRLP